MESSRILLKPFFSEEEKNFESDETLLPAVISLDMRRNEDDVIVLGRNAITGLIEKPGKNLHYVSRNHAELLIKDRKLFLKPSSKMKGIVQLNGCACVDEETELKIGDKICLLGAQKFFNFEVCKGPNEDDNASDGATAKVNEVTRALTEKVLRQYECSICYETMAFAHSLSCGDSFCYSCISDWAAKQGTCPLCQAAFHLQQAILNKTVNSAIRDTLGGGADSERAQEWERRYEEGLQQKKLKAAALPSSTTSSSSSLSSSAPTNNTNSNTNSNAAPFPAGRSTEPYPLEYLRSVYSARQAGTDLYAPATKRLRRLDRQQQQQQQQQGGVRGRAAFPLFAAIPLPAAGDGAVSSANTSGLGRSHVQHRLAEPPVVDLTATFPDDFPAELSRMSAAFTNGPPQPHPCRRAQLGRRAIIPDSSSSSAAASSSSSSSSSSVAADLCMAVYVSEIPAYQTPAVALNCDHCKQSLRTASAAASASPSSSFLLGRQDNSDVVIGIVPDPSADRSQQAWLALCERWVHPTCLRGVNRDRALRHQGPVLYGSLKYTELLSFSARQHLARIMLSA